MLYKSIKTTIANCCSLCPELSIHFFKENALPVPEIEPQDQRSGLVYRSFKPTILNFPQPI